MQTDVFIVGGGPAGLAAAIAARKKGLEAIVADGGKFPIEKVCGEGLMPGTVQLLTEMGVGFRSGDGREFCGISFLDGNKQAQANFPKSLGVGMRRRRLHQRLVEAAERSGATLLWNSPVTELRRDGVCASGSFFSARWIIGADGSGSRIAQWSGLRKSARCAYRFARQQHFAIKPWSDYVEIYWSARSQAYVTPVSENEICVAMLGEDPNARMSTLLLEHKELAERLGERVGSTVERGAVTGTHRLRRVTKDNVLLIGDASGTVDAITGEGMRLGFEHAIAAVDAIVSGDLRQYERRHRQIARRPSAMAGMLQILNNKPRLRERVLHVLSEAPELFEKLLHLHIGDSSVPQTLGAAAGFGWRLLFA